MAAPWAMMLTLRGSTSKPSHSRAGRLGHDHHAVRQRRDIVQHRPLMWRRVGENCVGNHDGGDVQTAQDLEYLVTVGASVESVFVVHHCHIELVEQVRTRDKGRRRPVDQLADHPIATRRLPAAFNDPDHAHLGVVRRQSGRQRCRERGQTAGSRGIGAEDPERASAPIKAFDGQVRDAHRCSSRRLGRGVEPARSGVGRHGRPAQAKRLSQGDEIHSIPQGPVVRSVGPRSTVRRTGDRPCELQCGESDGEAAKPGSHSGSFRSSLSSVFKILPVDPLGSMSRISTRRGYL